MPSPPKPIQHRVRRIRRGVWSYDLVWMDGSQPNRELVEECYNREHAQREGRRHAEKLSREIGWRSLTTSQSAKRYQKRRLKHAVAMKRTLEAILNVTSVREARRMAAKVLAESIPDEDGEVFAKAA